MSLALHLGTPVDAMLHAMTEDEFRRWQNYASKNLLPFARLELMLAQVCMLIARTMGGAKDVRVVDFIPRPPEDTDQTISALEVTKRAFGFKPRPKLRRVV